MAEVLRALGAAFRTLWRPRILALVLWPPLLALLLWGLMAYFAWEPMNQASDAWAESVGLTELLRGWEWLLLAKYLSTILVLLALLPVLQITALLIAGIIAMPAAVDEVARAHYPALARRRGGTTAGSAWNALAATFIYLLLWVLALPLLLVPPLAPLLPVLLTAYLNQRLFRYDALAEHADADEMPRVLEACGGRLYLLGVAVSVLQFTPLVNLVAPVYSALAYAHLGLGELARQRGAVTRG